MTSFRAASSAFFVFLLSCGLAQAQTPLSLAIHGPGMVNEALNSEYRAVVSWSDGTRSSVSVAWTAAWSSANPAALFITPFGTNGTLTTGNVAGGSTVNIGATFFGPTGPMNAGKSVTVLDASSFPSVAHTLAPGWTLAGNSIGAPVSAVSLFGNLLQPVPGVTDKVVSVWKWDAVNSRWAFFTPAMTPAQLVAFAASKTYSVLQVIQPGEGYWVNVAQPIALPARSAGPISLAASSIVNGWNLLSTSQAISPPDLNRLLSGDLPPAVPQNFISLWSWDADTGKWLYYAPALELSGGLAAVKAFTDASGFLDFATENRQLGHGTAFWIHSATVNTNSNLAPLGQAKAMFSELRTTVRAYVNDIQSGFLDAQSTRISNDLTGKVAPNLSWTMQYWDLVADTTRLFVDVRDANTSSYAVVAGTAGGTVRASRTLFNGSVQISCFSNDMAGALVTPALLTSVFCNQVDFNFTAYIYSFPDRTQVTLRASVTAGATANDFNYSASKRLRLETWNGSSYQFVSNTQIGATQTGAFSRTYLAGTTNVSAFSLAGNLPPRDADADHDAVNVTAARVPQDVPNSLYRYNIVGSIASKTAGDVSMVTLSIAGGSYFDAKEDASGNPLPNSLQLVHVVGKAETSASRFTGTLDLNAFARDADGAEYVPASSVFDGLMEDLSAGGAGVFLTGRLTITLNNLAAYHSLQPESAGNFLLYDTAFVGTIQAPSRPEMSLTAGSVRTGLDAYTITTNYTYGAVSVIGTGTLDTFNMANSILTLTNQDGITVTFQPHADAAVMKGATTLGVIPFGSAIVYFTDGYFESL